MQLSSCFVVLGNPVNHFPIYQPSEERIAEIAKAHADENNPLGVHYDAAKEVRAKGAGFYQFSADEETRAAQMEELKASREETGRIRAELGAEDIRAGEVEGMKDIGSSTGAVKSRAMEKRKRELEERRKLLESKRRKIRPDRESTPTSATNSNIALPNDLGPQDLATKDSKPLKPSPLESQSIPQPSTSTIVNKTVDPFAALEAQTVPSTRQNQKKGPAVPENEADCFLAQLESEFLGSRNRKPS